MIGSLISIPNIGLLARFSPLVLFIDEYSYYKYHEAKYDRSFTFISRLYWNWTNDKWVPSILDDLYSKYSETANSWLDLSQDPATVPERFRRFGEDCFFLNNT